MDKNPKQVCMKSRKVLIRFLNKTINYEYLCGIILYNFVSEKYRVYAATDLND